MIFKKLKRDLAEKRIIRYEKIFDCLKQTLKDNPQNIKTDKTIKTNLKKLEKYYTGSLWAKDFAADEKGFFPADLKRGVLSEDGIYNLLEEYKTFLL
ncbi:MAG: DUF4298 domain-containing protein [Treponema sp.]|nr:DUF4298 domain-containing protein [Treponema sp.]